MRGGPPTSGKRWIVLAVAVLLGAAAAFLVWNRTAREAVELAAGGGEMVLRDPMRPPRGGPRVLLVALDGVGDGELREALRTGGMPSLAALLGAPQGADLFEYGYAAPGTLSVLPSTTMAAWTSVYTGRPPSETGVPGNEWFAREEMRFYAPGPVSVTEMEHTLKLYSDGLLGAAVPVPTLFERLDLRAHVSLAPVHRGADLLTAPDLADLGELFGAVASGLADKEPAEREAYAAVDRQSVEEALEAIERHGLPDLQVVYFPGVDLYTHLADSPLEQMRLYLEEVLDPAIGRILEAYRARGALEETWVVLVSDHGHTPVLREERNALATSNTVDPPALLLRAGYRVRPFELDPGDGAQDYQAVLAYQGAIAYVYLADRSTCPQAGQRCDWLRPPRLEEDVLPLVRALDRVNRTGDPIPELAGTLDLIFAREPRPTTEPALPFQVWDGERLVPVGAYLATNPRPDLLRLEERLEALAAGPLGHRAGDVLLLARSGLNRPIAERFYFSELYSSWHGSPEAQDSEVPLLVARAGTPGREIESRVRAVVGDAPSQLHVVPLILSLAGRR